MKKVFKFLLFILVVGVILWGIAFAALPLPGHVPVLMYHFIGTDHDAKESKNFVSKQSFANHMKWLKRFGYRVISLDDLHAIKTGERKAKGREIAITFDDGNYTFGSDAFPILNQYAYPTTVFVVSESVKRKIHGSMPIDEISRLLNSDWFEIGAHTKTHPFLSEMKEDKMREELEGSKKDLEEIFGRPIRYVAYPYGDFDERVMRVAEEIGFDLAFTTSYKKLKTYPEGPYSLTRVKMTRSADHPVIFWFKVSGIYDFLKMKRSQLKHLISS